MPTYEYTCTACGHRLEAVQKFSDAALTVCPECNGELRKVYGAVGIVLKGSGFYKTDSRAASGNGKKASAKSESSSTESTSSSSESSSSSDSSSSSESSSSSNDSSSSSKSEPKAAAAAS